MPVVLALCTEIRIRARGKNNAAAPAFTYEWRGYQPLRPLL